MSGELEGAIQSEDLRRFCRVMDAGTPPPSASARRLNIDPGELRNGLAQLVLTVIKLLHELMERQAIARMDAGDLSEADIERLGTTLMRQSEKIDELREAFGLSEEDLNLDLGPLGSLL
jgi:hypothetical protein